MAARGRETRLATMETTHPSFPTLFSLQTENSRPKSSMRVNALVSSTNLEQDLSLRSFLPDGGPTVFD